MRIDADKRSLSINLKQDFFTFAVLEIFDEKVLRKKRE